LCCCPQILTDVVHGSCTANKQLVTFFATVTNSTACTFTIRRAYGDGNVGNVFTVGPHSILTLPPEQHYYPAPATYTSTIEILSPPPLSACAGLDPKTISASCGSCYSQPWIAGLCRFFEFAFLFSMTAALSVGLSQPCIPISVGGILLAAAFVALAVYLFLQCQYCTCDFLVRDWGVILIAAGLVNIMFIPSGCATTTGPAAAINSIVLLTLGVVVLWLWYGQHKLTCPLLICDFWCAAGGALNILSATSIALTVAIVLTASFPILYPNVGWALAAAVAVIIFVWNVPLSNSPCQQTPTCK